MTIPPQGHYDNHLPFDPNDPPYYDELRGLDRYDAIVDAEGRDLAIRDEEENY